MENFYIITRKYVLIPLVSTTKEWNKNVEKSINIRISNNERISENSKDKELIKSCIENIEKQKQYLEEISNGSISNKLAIDYSYWLIIESMKSEAVRKNVILSTVYSKYMECVSSGIEFSETKDIIKEIFKKSYRVKGSKKGSLFDNIEIDSFLSGYGNSFSQELTNEFWTAVKKGIQYGNCSLPTYKNNSPFTINRLHYSLTHDYDSFEELCEHWKDNNLKLYFNFGGNGKPTIAKFLINTGHGKNHDELMSVLLKVYSGEYECCGSSIQINEKGKIILNLTMKCPKKEISLDEDTVVGVDLGLAVPAVCSLNNSEYAKMYIGNAQEFVNHRTKIKYERSRMSKNLANCKGGHGRKKKLRAIERYKDYEANWVQNYNHMVSKRVVDFAIKNNAKYINMENLAGFGEDEKNKFILANWSYYQLQSYIKDKANRNGIIVRTVNPYHTSQACSCCGSELEDQRVSQSEFICKNPKCKNYGKTVNADLNASRNIAKSKDWSEGKHKVETLKKQHEDYLKKLEIENQSKKKTTRKKKNAENN